MKSTTAADADRAKSINGHGESAVGQVGRSSHSNSNASSTGATKFRDRRSSLESRPIVASHRRQSSPFDLSNQDSSQEDSDTDRVKRRPKSILRRSKSDYGPRGDGTDTDADIDDQNWGARHGFEDHYASEEYVSQLANVRLFTPLYLKTSLSLPQSHFHNYECGCFHTA